MPNGKSVRVQCLRCGHFSVLTPDLLSRLAIGPNTPIAAFVKGRQPIAPSADGALA